MLDQPMTTDSWCLHQECLQVVKEIGNELERNAEVCNRAALEVNPCYPIIALQLPVFILAWPPAPLTWVDVLFI